MEEETTWKIIHEYFNSNPNTLISHHLDSYNDFLNNGLKRIFREKNPIKIIKNQDPVTKEFDLRCNLYLGGKEGNRIYFGKPVIFDETREHYMFPNEARLRNMTYGTTIHYDVDVEFFIKEGTEIVKSTMTLPEKIYLGKFPIMLNSDLCILKNLSLDVKFNMGECKNDPGGYFIIDGKEKVIVPQEKFADNMLYIRDKVNDLYSHSAEIRSVSEDASKPIRTLSVKIVSPSSKFSNKQIVVDIPNVRMPMPLFIVMRALGIESDKDIIKCCLLDLEKYDSYVDLFIPSVHDASKIFTQENALKYISTFTKTKTIAGTLHILADYFLPHVGELNFISKAYFLGHMTFQLLKVYTKDEKATDRDSFNFKRVELPGMLMYDLFKEYYTIQQKNIFQKIDKEYFYKKTTYQNNFISLIENNYRDFFKDRIVEEGFRKAFKGNWGSEAHTKRLGVVQPLNRLSYNSFIAHLRKINLPMDSSAKVVKPRLLHSSQWGIIDPVDTPDGGNVGFHKHLAITAKITNNCSSLPIIKLLRNYANMLLLEECSPKILSQTTKVFVNGNWVGNINNPIDTLSLLKCYRRNVIIPIYTSISWNVRHNEFIIYTDAGRLCRPIFYIDEITKTISYNKTGVMQKLKSGEFTWNELITGFNEKKDSNFSIDNCKVYNPNELYDIKNDIFDLVDKQCIIEYIDTAESETALIALNENFILKGLNVTDLSSYNESNDEDQRDQSDSEDNGYEETKGEDIHNVKSKSKSKNKSKLNSNNDVKKLSKKINTRYTHIEIHPSFLLGVLGNQIVFPENNQLPRDVFACGQSRQALSLYHSNYQTRIDKMGVILNYGQIPLVKSRYMKYVNREEHPYGENVVVAIGVYGGYNVEDSILFNEGSIKRGMFRTTYFSMYESREESSKVGNNSINSKFANIETTNVIGLKAGYDYSELDKYGLIKENTPMDDKKVLIGKVVSNIENPNNFIDDSVFPKKGQLGYVDKSFITEGEEGFRLAKVRIREERLPGIGDKFCSRCGQKGTVGMIISERDMPYTRDGIKPDIIINPHALPSRMTIGQLIETLMGKACSLYGGFGDCTAFVNKGSKHKKFGELLTSQGFHSTGNEILYNGQTGEQMASEIFIGPTYYMRLKHMVKDKINYRAQGPRTVLTRQTVQGRANDGGLRIGEMERDGIISHGASKFLEESLMVRGDEYYMAVCNQSGTIAVYNESLNLFLSPYADGPIQFTNISEYKADVVNISKYGKEFSIVRIPYAFKLLMQELKAMNIDMKIITEENIDQLTSMSFSNNYNKLVNNNKISLKQIVTEAINSQREDKRDTFNIGPEKERSSIEKDKEYAEESGWIFEGETEEGEVYRSILLDDKGNPTELWYVSERGFNYPNIHPNGWNRRDLYDIDLPVDKIIENLKQQQIPNNWNIVINKLKQEYPFSPRFSKGSKSERYSRDSRDSRDSRSSKLSEGRKDADRIYAEEKGWLYEGYQNDGKELYRSILLDEKGLPTQLWYISRDKNIYPPIDYPKGWNKDEMYNIDLPTSRIIEALINEQVPNNWNIVISRLKQQYPVYASRYSSDLPRIRINPNLSSRSASASPFVSPAYNPLTPTPSTPVSSPPYIPVVYTPQTPSGTPPSLPASNSYNPTTPTYTPSPLQVQPQVTVTNPVYVPVVYTPQSDTQPDDFTSDTNKVEIKKIEQKEIGEANLLTDVIELEKEEQKEESESKKIISNLK
jgi:DNA-directed RNA polymerase II subunit RPB2